MASALEDIEQLSSVKFGWENAIRTHRLHPPLSVSGPRILVEEGWQLIGYTTGKVPGERDDQIAIMLFHSEHGELWQHFPEAAANQFPFVCRKTS